MDPEELLGRAVDALGNADSEMTLAYVTAARQCAVLTGTRLDLELVKELEEALEPGLDINYNMPDICISCWEPFYLIGGNGIRCPGCEEARINGH